MGSALQKLEQLAPSGHQPDVVEADEPIYLWPCNEPAWNHWLQVQFQWNDGANGRTSLNYPGVVAYLDEEGLQGEERKDLWLCFRAIERELLALWAERREAAEKQRQQQQSNK